MTTRRSRGKASRAGTSREGKQFCRGRTSILGRPRLCTCSYPLTARLGYRLAALLFVAFDPGAVRPPFRSLEHRGYFELRH